jgi:DNA-damage-inducible protein D
MSGDMLERADGRTFEEIKHVDEHGAEYWNARELQPLLGYGQWRSFQNAISKALISCQKSGNDPDHHFARARKMIDLGKGGKREVDEYHLSRFACHLIAQNGDPRKPEIARAQKYFAIQTRRQAARGHPAGRTHQTSQEAAEEHAAKAATGRQRCQGACGRVKAIECNS